MRIPEQWNAANIRYEHPGGAYPGEQDNPVFLRAPTRQAPTENAPPEAVRAGPGQGMVASGNQPWTPPAGPQSTGVMPPLTDRSPAAQAFRMFPAASQAEQRVAAQQKIMEDEAKGTQAAEKNQTAITVQQMRNDGTFQNTLAKLQSDALTRNDSNAAKMMATINAAIRSPQGWDDLPPELKNYAQQLFTRFRGAQSARTGATTENVPPVPRNAPNNGQWMRDKTSGAWIYKAGDAYYDQDGNQL
jgi:cell division septum initiation protein DivIVA